MRTLSLVADRHPPTGPNGPRTYVARLRGPQRGTIALQTALIGGAGVAFGGHLRTLSIGRTRGRLFGLKTAGQVPARIIDALRVRIRC